MHNNDHYRDKKRKKTNRMKNSSEQQITNYRTLYMILELRELLRR